MNGNVHTTRDIVIQLQNIIFIIIYGKEIWNDMVG